MHVRKTAKRAFTLVEILIVVVILGILAAIVVPQFTNATEDAQGGNIQSQLSTLQNQIELFRARENRYPTLAEMQADPTVATANGTSFGELVDQGYLKDSPRNPAVPSDAPNQWTVAAAAGDNIAWVYDDATGELTAGYYDEDAQDVTPGTP